MPEQGRQEITRRIVGQLAKTSPPAWLLDMIEYHRRTGTYRPRDLRRLLGKPKESVAVPSEKSVEAALLAAVHAKA